MTEGLDGGAPPAADVVVVGAGPVGLWTALQIKKRSPLFHVVMYERHTTYQRSHVLRLDHWSLILYSRNSRSPSEQQFYEEVTGKQLSGVRTQFAKSLYIRTHDLEQALKSHALREGIEIRYEKVPSLEWVEDAHPECQFFVASDGASSPLRAMLLGDNSAPTTPLQHVLELKYEERGATSKASLWDEFTVNRKLQNMAFSYVGRPRGDCTPVTLRLFVDELTYAQLPAMSFRDPFAYGTAGLPPEVAADIEAFFAARAAETGAPVVEGSVKLSKLVLSMYCAKRFGVLRGTRAWFLVGDAAMGVPYFRALNSGLILGSRLAQLICSRVYPARGNLGGKVMWYEVHRKAHKQTEFGIARGKDMLLEGFDSLRLMCASPF